MRCSRALYADFRSHNQIIFGSAAGRFSLAQ